MMGGGLGELMFENKVQSSGYVSSFEVFFFSNFVVNKFNVKFFVIISVGEN